MTINDNALLLLAGGLAVATVLALVASLMGPVGWEDETLWQGVALAAHEIPDWSQTIW